MILATILGTIFAISLVWAASTISEMVLAKTEETRAADAALADVGLCRTGYESNQDAFSRAAEARDRQRRWENWCTDNEPTLPTGSPTLKEILGELSEKLRRMI